MKTVSEWDVNLHVEGEPLFQDERIRIPVDGGIWEWIAEQLAEVEQATTV